MTTRSSVSSRSLLDRFPARVRQSLRTRLTKWYQSHGRSLPWRESRDPYRIWISEIMLQQTTVKAVIPYYTRFLDRFPTLSALADATEEEVLQYWEGLGYYSRGRNLRRAAQAIQSQYAGRFPQSPEEIQKLPGIGRYTAGAISSFAFDIPAPIVEANTLRLYCRLLGFDGDPRSRSGQELLWDFASALQPPDRAGILNQALMELGSLVCTPTNPQCESCPLQTLCVAGEEGRQSEIPAPKVRPETTATVEGTVAIRHQNRFLIRQRGKKERWAGMWDFPRFPIETLSSEAPLSGTVPASLQQEFRRQLKELGGPEISRLAMQLEVRHSVTRYRIRLICCSAETTSAAPHFSADSGDWRWVALETLQSLPMPITGRKFARHLRSVAEKPE